MLAKAPRVPSSPPWAAAGYEKEETAQGAVSANAPITN
jgi:hypothetical protein